MLAGWLDREERISYGVPTAVVALSIVALFWLPDPFQLVIPPAALVSGYLFRPGHVWGVWAAVVLVLAAVIGLLALVGYELPKATDPRMSFGDFVTSAVLFVPYVGIIAMLPLWLGRFLAGWRERRREGAAATPAD